MQHDARRQLRSKAVGSKTLKRAVAAQALGNRMTVCTVAQLFRSEEKRGGGGGGMADGRRGRHMGGRRLGSMMRVCTGASMRQADARSSM